MEERSRAQFGVDMREGEAMPKLGSFFHKINVRILLLLILLLACMILAVSAISYISLSDIYERKFEERAILSNALIVSIIENEVVEYFVQLIKAQDDEFRRAQVQFFHDRTELAALVSRGISGARKDELTNNLAQFHEMTSALKTDEYWHIIDELRMLRDITQVHYVYVFANTGLYTEEGGVLATFIFDSEDCKEYAGITSDGLGTVAIYNKDELKIINEMMLSRQAMNHVMRFYDDIYGELYFLYAPILNDEMEVIAFLGISSDFVEMRREISDSVLRFITIFLAFTIIIILVIYIYLSTSVIKPLDNLTETAGKIEAGDVYAEVSAIAIKRKCEIGALARAFDDVSKVYQNMIRSSKNMFDAAHAGKLDVHNDVSAYKGDMRTVMEQINATIAALLREKQHAEEASNVKSNFLATMSHEIRTPMNTIISMATMGKSAMDADRKDYCLNKIEDASMYLLGIINDILDMSKIEANKYELSIEAFDFEKMLNRAVNVVSTRAEEKRQRLAVNIDKAIPDALIGDDRRIAQVITNLLGNSIKFTPEEGSVTLDAVFLGEEDGVCHIQISVIDTGIGISPEQQGKLFQIFHQADSNTTRKYGGTGLGLAISKNIVEMMDGKIWIESELGEGATFRFTFKAKRQVPQAGETGSAASENGYDETEAGQNDIQGIFSSRCVLLAEDVEINREIVIALLEPTQIEIVCAENGKEAVRLFREAPEKYDMIFMDIRMPEMDGYDATSTIRALDIPTAKTVPIVAMTANVFQEDIEKSKASGMNEHLGKPLNFGEVLEVLKKYLK
ncbi:MAG: ATP-binding protein [Oscillospiraceae bacterium]|nr:ATP-binding protein [Oscillospiraceae bacterium]